MVKTALVAVKAESYIYDRPYSYYLPPELETAVQPGMRVQVPFGKGNRMVQGIVLGRKDGESAEGLKPVGSVIDDEPIVSERELKLILWMREKYFCTCFDVFRLCIPAGSDIREEVRYARNLECTAKPLKPGLSAAAVLDYVAERGEVSLPELEKRFPGDALEPDLDLLIRRKFLTSRQHALLHNRDKTVTCAALVGDGECVTKLTRQQLAVVDYLRSAGNAAVKEITYYTGSSAATVKTLEKRGVVRLFEREVLRLTAPKDGSGELLPDPVLNGEQQRAFDGLSCAVNAHSPSAALLHGVTGSGKTMVYIRLVRHCLRMGRQAMVLVPEISLTPQLLGLMHQYFGGQVAILHSGLSVGERYDEWKRIRTGRANVVVGTRSAVFAPLDNIGLLVIDEEQEGTYASEQSPRYHARDVAKFRAVQHGALLLLASATPSVETMYAAKSGKYAYYRLENRYGGVLLPTVEFADMKQELRRGNETHISGLLADAIRDALSAGEQSILFLNRRGANRNMLCRSCGYVPQCEACSVAMTYHSANNRLMCHYCSRSVPVYEFCPKCGSAYISREGVGTQRIAEELNALFPGTEIIRMDADTTGGANSHESLLERFRREKVPILLGTQMIAKGLNFPNVTLVGVIDGDQGLHAPDFRANEHAFSQLTQVVGRAGRGEKPGRAVIQTYSPEQEILRLAAAQDYDRFYESEAALRRALTYPPFCDLLRVTLSGMENSRALAAARWIRDALAACVSPDGLFEPAPAPIFKLNNRYRYQVIAKTEETRQLRQTVSSILRAFLSEKRFDGVSAAADLNPQE